MLKGLSKTAIIILSVICLLIGLLILLQLIVLSGSEKNDFFINFSSNLLSNFFTGLFIALFLYLQNLQRKKKTKKRPQTKK